VPVIGGPALPVGEIIRSAYARVFGEADLLLQSGGLWWAILVLAYGFLAFVLPEGGEPAERSFGASALAVLATVLTLVAAGAIAVAWHRRVLLDEVPSGPMAPLGRRVTAYIAWSLVIGLLASLPAMVLLPLALTGGGALGSAALVAALAVSLYGLARLSPILPGRAIDAPNLRLVEAWRMSDGQGWRIAVVLAAVTLPGAVLGSLLVAVVGALPGTGILLPQGVDLAASLVNAALGAVGLSLVYRHLNRGGGLRPVT
jgi:hypothetical protein